jgi:preprotein translocase subunit SecE
MKGTSSMISKKNNIALWVLSVLLGGFAIINQQAIEYNHIFLQFIITVTLTLIAIFLLLKKTTQGSRFSKYWVEAVSELKKVTWPNRKETMQTTAVVVVMVIVMGLILWTVDAILIRLVAWLLQRGGG